MRNFKPVIYRESSSGINIVVVVDYDLDIKMRPRVAQNFVFQAVAPS